METYEKVLACVVLYIAGVWTGAKIEENHFSKVIKNHAKIEEIVNYEGRILELSFPLQPDSKFNWIVYSFTEKEKGKFFPYQEEIKSKLLKEIKYR